MDYRNVFLDKPEKVVVVKEDQFPRPNEVPSFVSAPHYAVNFSKQWLRFRDTQLDSRNGTTISREFLERIIGYSISELRGATVLEVGAGAGRFTEYLVRHAAMVVAVDLSEAIFVNVALPSENLVAAQADLFKMPRMALRFDVVICRGVLQHTPDPMAAIQHIHDWVKPGGYVAFDIYSKGRLGRLAPKYLYRPLVRRMFSFDRFAEVLGRVAGPMLRLRWFMKPILPGRTKRILDYFVPVWDYKDILPLAEETLIEWGILDTLDAMYAYYDNPLDFDEVIGRLGDLNYEVLAAERSGNIFRSRPRR